MFLIIYSYDNIIIFFVEKIVTISYNAYFLHWLPLKDWEDSVAVIWGQ